jgi:hypothetical protein
MSLLRSTAADLVDFAQRQVDRIAPKESRQKAYSRTKDFATARPLLFSFLVAQAVFSIMPVLFFLTFAFSVLFFAATASLLFSLFWTGIAVFVLVPILVMASSVALFTWAFGLATFSASRSAYGTFQQLTAARAPLRGDADNRRHPVAPIASSASSSPASWTKVEGQDIKQDAGPKGKEKTPAHPDPGSDVDALEP